MMKERMVTVELLVNPFCMAERDVDTVGKMCRELNVSFTVYNINTIRENPTIFADAFQPLLDFAISSLSKSYGRFSHQVGLVLNLIQAHYRRDDCLCILDLEIERQSQRYNVDRELVLIAEPRIRLQKSEAAPSRKGYSV